MTEVPAVAAMTKVIALRTSDQNARLPSAAMTDVITVLMYDRQL
jgi:hypothetical protein